MKTCSKCGEYKALSEFSPRKTSKDGLQGKCKVCRNATNRQWCTSNRDVARDSARRWDKANRERKLAYGRRYVADNAERIKLYKRQHYLNNPGYYREMSSRRERELDMRTYGDRKEIRQIYATCPEGYHVDHIVPLKGVNSKGEHVVCGLHAPWNLQHLPAEENLRKSNKFEENE